MFFREFFFLRVSIRTTIVFFVSALNWLTYKINKKTNKIRLLFYLLLVLPLLTKPIIMIEKKSDTGRYVDPTSDFGFKFYFGRPENKSLLILLLNGLFQGEKVIKNLWYTLTEEDGESEDQRRVIFDIRCIGEDGEQFIIEMQKIAQNFFKDRMVFYTSRVISGLLEKGHQGDNYCLPEVYFIGILEFPVGEKYFYDIALRDHESQEVFYEKLGYKLLCLPNFTKRGPELNGAMDQWLYTLKNISVMKKMSKYLDPKVIGPMFDIGEVGKLKADELMEYQASLKRKMDTEAAFAYVRREGEEQGRREGRREGEEKGRREGEEKVVRNLMLSTDMTDDQICDLTGVDLVLIKKVRTELEQER